MRPKTEGLTKMQQLVLEYIKKYQSENNFPPTIRKISDDLKLNSPATVHVHIKHLIEKGYIKRNEDGYKSIEILVDNEYDSKCRGAVSSPLINTNKYEDVMGELKDPKHYFPIPTKIIGRGKECFAYVMNDDSMNRLNINKSDIIIIEKTNAACNEDIVIAEHDDNTYLRKYKKEKGVFTLNNGNDEEDIQLDKITILGVARGLYRKL